jgi:PhzF family phenazine biosynthesis protein
VGVPLLLVDAFTDGPFSGNPAAVCLLPAWRDDRWLQSLAAEMKHSETAYLVRNADGFDLRWFTPAIEVALCGHATLASAHALWEQGVVPADAVIRFATKSGTLTATPRNGRIELDFPLNPEEPVEPPAELLPALGVTARYVGKSRFDYLVEVESEAIVRNMTPDFRRLAGAPVRGTIVTSRSISSRDSSHRPPASTRTRSPARPTAASPRTGRNGWARTSSSRTRRRPAAVSCTFASLTIGCCWAARPSPCSRAN